MFQKLPFAKFLCNFGKNGRLECDIHEKMSKLSCVEAD